MAVGAVPMAVLGVRRGQAVRLQFDGKFRLEFHGATIASDAGPLPFREPDKAVGLTEKGSTVAVVPRFSVIGFEVMNDIQQRDVLG